MRFFRAVQALAVIAAAFVLGSCQTTTPAERIEQNPLLFRQLSPEQKMMVQQGKICEGMTKDAVFLAWGEPNTPPVFGQRNGVSYEKWVYSTYKPVMVDTVIGGGFGVGRHWHGGGLGTSTAYVAQPVAWVMFNQDKVTSWEKYAD